jgi:hypothetical protein
MLFLFSPRGVGIAPTIKLSVVNGHLSRCCSSPAYAVLEQTNRSQRVAFTAAASFKGFFAWARIVLSRSGFFARNTAISCVPLRVLHGSQAKQRLLTLSVPPLALACMCSTWRGISFFWQ